MPGIKGRMTLPDRIEHTLTCGKPGCQAHSSLWLTQHENWKVEFKRHGWQKTKQHGWICELCQRHKRHNWRRHG